MARNRVNRRPDRPASATLAGEPAGDYPEKPAGWADWVDPRRVGWLNLLLAAVPVAIVLSLAGASASWRFAASCLAIIPLAGLMGTSTEQLSHKLGAGVGGLLNATFGNAAELILAMFALSRGLDDVVKASLTGSIIGNLLLVLGASILAGGLKYPIQRFNRTAAGVGSTLMVLASVGLMVPALFHGLVGPGEAGLEHRLSLAVCVILILAYGLNLLFSLGTHKDVFSGVSPEAGDKIVSRAHGNWGLRKSLVVLLVATAFVAWMSEILVGAVEATGHALGLGGVFMGVIVVAIVGNAAEHSTAVIMARKDQMDLAVGIALGSALQVALFVAPVLVFASYLRATPMDLRFTALEVVAVVLTAVLARMVAEDGESNWLEGAMLLMVYAILAVAFFFMPAGVGSHGH